MVKYRKFLAARCLSPSLVHPPQIIAVLGYREDSKKADFRKNSGKVNLCDQTKLPGKGACRAPAETIIGTDPMDAPFSAFPLQPIPQVGVVPFRIVGTQTEFCLVTSRRSGRWGFPKGRVSGGNSLLAAALDEAHEEAGLIGRIHGTQLGQYGYNKKGKAFEVLMWLMHVELCEPTWKESQERSRVWVRLAEARRLIDRPHLDQLLMLAANRLANPEPEPRGLSWSPTMFAPLAFDPFFPQRQ
jgi:8-oxo-dGTP pyrophosphatase MutT (NUDIX family)